MLAFGLVLWVDVFGSLGNFYFSFLLLGFRVEFGVGFRLAFRLTLELVILGLV